MVSDVADIDGGEAMEVTFEIGDWFVLAGAAILMLGALFLGVRVWVTWIREHGE